MGRCIFLYVIAVEGQYLSLHMVNFVEISCFHEFCHGLWHTTDDKILPEIVHCLAVHHLPHLVLFSKFMQIRGMSVSLPRAQRNSSKSIGYMRISSSSDGIMMFSTFFLIETSEPVSM